MYQIDQSHPDASASSFGAPLLKVLANKTIWEQLNIHYLSGYILEPLRNVNHSFLNCIFRKQQYFAA